MSLAITRQRGVAASSREDTTYSFNYVLYISVSNDSVSYYSKMATSEGSSQALTAETERSGIFSSKKAMSEGSSPTIPLATLANQNVATCPFI